MLRIDPHLAVFRPAPDRIAVGAQDPVAVLDADPPTLRAIAAMTRGVLPQELEQLIGQSHAQALLNTLAPALIEASPVVPVLVRGRMQLAEQLHRAARDAGHPAGEGSVIVPVAAWRMPDAETDRLLAAGAAHLPVVVGDAWVQVGPYVAAGGGCTQCSARLDPPVLPAHLAPAPTQIALAQCIVTVLDALRRAGEGELQDGWATRIRQRDGVVSAVRRRRPCQHLRALQPVLDPSAEERSRRGSAKAA